MESQKPKVLVVDDRKANRVLYRQWLAEIPEIETLEASNGSEALALAREHEFAVFLLDISMPEMDGFELASMLRLEPKAESTPIIFLTAEARDRTYLMRGYRMGAVDFLVNEPVDSEIVVSKARVFLQLFRKRQEVQRMLDQVRLENVGLHQKLEDFIRQQEKLREQATHDSLTKLPNRALFRDRLDRAIKRTQRSRQRFALAYLDLDGFKQVNDTHGHATGDELIVSVAERLLFAVRGTDTVARLGGDEFGILFEGLDSQAPASYLAEKVQRVLMMPAMLRSEAEKGLVEIRIGASIGVAMYPDHADNDQDLIALADSTMYAAKRAGGGARVYHPSVEGGARLTLVRDRGEGQASG